MREIRRVTDIMGEIAAASQEQSKGIGQVNQAITQQNAALVEEAAAAASSLESQVGDLKTAVSMFRLDVSHDAGVRGAAAQTPTVAPSRARAPARPALKQFASQPARIAQTS